MSPNMKYRKIKYLLVLHFMPLLPPTLPSLRPYSYASRLPRLVVMLPLVLRRLSLLSRHCLLSGGASTCPLLVVPPPLIMPLFFSSALASCPPRLFVVSLLVLPLPPVCLHLCLSLHCRLLWCPSCVSCLASCHVASHHAHASLHRCLQLSSHRCLWLRPSCASRPLWLVVV